MAPLGIPTGDPDRLGASSLRSLSARISRSSFSSSSADTSSSILHAVRRFASVVRRQGTVVVSTTYQGLKAGPPPGNVAGIVLGSVAGALLVLWLLYMCFNLRKAPARSSIEDVGVEVLQNNGGRRSHRHSHSTPSNRRSVSREVVEVRSPRRQHRERERVRETVVVEERRSPRREEEDIVEVIEEHSPPPRRHSSRRR